MRGNHSREGAQFFFSFLFFASCEHLAIGRDEMRQERAVYFFICSAGVWVVCFDAMAMTTFLLPLVASVIGKGWKGHVSQHTTLPANSFPHLARRCFSRSSFISCSCLFVCGSPYVAFCRRNLRLHQRLWTTTLASMSRGARDGQPPLELRRRPRRQQHQLVEEQQVVGARMRCGRQPASDSSRTMPWRRRGRRRQRSAKPR